MKNYLIKKNCKEKNTDISEYFYKGLYCIKILEKNELNPKKKIEEVGYMRKKKL